MMSEVGDRSSSSSGRRLKSIIRRCSKRPRSTSPPPIKSNKKKKSVRVEHCPPPTKSEKKSLACGVEHSLRRCWRSPPAPEGPLDLLFTRDRDFLIRNNGQKVSARDLKGKTVVLYIVQIDCKWYMAPEVTLDMVEAYQQLLPLGGIEFVLVPVYIDRNPHTQQDKIGYSDRFNHLFSTLPFPAVPFSDIEACGDRIVHTFSVDNFLLPSTYWMIIDPTGTVVHTRTNFEYLFNFYGGAELYPLSPQRIKTLNDDFYGGGHHGGYRFPSRKRHISKWDQLLASPTRDFLLSSNGDHVPISSLKGKLIGLYFCENIPHPPRMDLIKEVYHEAKLHGYDFEIVQIIFHFQYCHASCEADFSEQQHYENINWLTLPFKDPSCRKIQRIFGCDWDNCYNNWRGDSLVIVDPRQTDDVFFDFSGAEIIEKYGIEGYPFNRMSVIETEYTRMINEVKLSSLFPPGLCQFTTQCDGFNLVNDSRLKGKRVLVLFANASSLKNNAFVPMLKSKYLEQTQEDKFEVVYVPTDVCQSECVQDMPWLVHPYSHQFGTWWDSRIFKGDFGGIEASAFDIDGKLMARDFLVQWVFTDPKKMEPRFPFFSLDLRLSIQEQVQDLCELGCYYGGEQVIKETSC